MTSFSYRYRLGEGLQNSTTFLDYFEVQVKGDKDDFAQECLRAHNHYRSEHGCSPLVLSPQLCDFSQEWADHLAEVDHLIHRKYSRYGENLFVTYLSDCSLPHVRGFHPVKSWYSEHNLYPFEEPEREDDVFHSGHFTQVIWNSSQEMGVGISGSKTNRIYVVANYHPAGNILSQFQENVPRKLNTLRPHRLYVTRVLSKRMSNYDYQAFQFGAA